MAALYGADGLGQMATGLVGQGLAIFDALRGGLNGHGDEKFDRGELDAPPRDRP